MSNKLTPARVKAAIEVMTWRKHQYSSFLDKDPNFWCRDLEVCETILAALDAVRWRDNLEETAETNIDVVLHDVYGVTDVATSCGDGDFVSDHFGDLIHQQHEVIAWLPLPVWEGELGSFF